MASRPKNGKGGKRTEAHDTLHKSKKYLVVDQQDFEAHLAQKLGFAYQHRKSESALYGVYNHIISGVSSTIKHPDFPHVTISHAPQAVLGQMDMPVDRNGNPVTKDSIFNEQLPDFVRTFIKASEDKDQDGNRRYETLPIDLWEIKPLKTDQPWDTEEARLAAAKIMEKATEQTWKQAMAAFAHNPGWQQIHVLLIVGVYFSQFKWMRPDGEIKRPLDDPPHVSKVLSGPELETLRKQYDDKIAEYQNRPLPEIVYFNVPVFEFARGGEERYQASLSPEFRYAMRLPLSQQQYRDCQYQRTWMSSPAKKPTRYSSANDKDRAERAVTRAIRNNHGKRLVEQRDKGWAIGDEPSPSVSSAHNTSFDSWGGSDADVEELRRAALATPLAARTRFAVSTQLGQVPARVPTQSSPEPAPGLPALGNLAGSRSREHRIQAIDFERHDEEEYDTPLSSDESQADSVEGEVLADSRYHVLNHPGNSRGKVNMHNEEDENFFVDTAFEERVNNRDKGSRNHAPARNLPTSPQYSTDEDRDVIDDHVASPDTSLGDIDMHYDADSEGLGNVRHILSDQAGTHPRMLSKDTKSRKKTLKHRKA